jgi:hypothetical protein
MKKDLYIPFILWPKLQKPFNSIFIRNPTENNLLLKNSKFLGHVEEKKSLSYIVMIQRVTFLETSVGSRQSQKLDAVNKKI